MPHAKRLPHFRKSPQENRVELNPEEWGIPEIPRLGWSQRLRRGKIMERHDHPDHFEIHFVKKGLFQYSVEGRPVPVKGGYGVVTLPGESQSSLGQPLDRSEFYWLKFSLQPGKAFFSFPAASTAKLFAFLKNRIPKHRVFPVSEAMFDLLKWLITWDPSSMPFPDGAARARFGMLLGLWVECLGKNGDGSLSAPVRRGIEAMNRHLAQNPGDGISVESLADQLGISRNHFQDRFRRETGYSPADFFLRLKVEAVKRELVAKKGKALLTDLAHRYFTSSQVFSRTFKRVTGLSPSQWQRSQTDITASAADR